MRRRQSIRVALVVLVASLVAVLPAAAAKTKPPALQTTIAFTLPATCTGFTTPFEVYGPGSGLWADLYVPGSYSSKFDDATGIRTTTVTAAGTDAEGVSFAVSAKFELEGVWNGSDWDFPYYGGYYGDGKVKITRGDRAKLVGAGSFVFGGITLGIPWVTVETATCPGKRDR